MLFQKGRVSGKQAFYAFMPKNPNEIIADPVFGDKKNPTIFKRWETWKKSACGKLQSHYLEAT